ncbi:hypothetical protein BKA00_006736 [Actinomadura coerulea]|uniref:Uncharacterized protein n=1 Tax=Actinomadura coerulea TaxID=46159 RepID=A0A7X0G5L6_9ACTN|nr:hypothetical protein [Actinomadura coerulea]MBB6399822.1 hypothetical protein [Actinomadura coerulea]GGQ16247.1 hypothetical protein GCM10010187_35570 [Actinomadura coerulea]
MNDLKERLESLADAPAPAPAVDVAAAVARARRIRRRRRAAALAVAAGVVAGAAGIAVVPPSSGDRPSAVAGPSRFPSPLVEKAAFGWLPPGYARTRVGQDAQRGTVFTVSAGRAPGSTSIELTVGPPGVAPGVPLLPGGRKGHLTRADPVNGRPAYWSIAPGGPGSDQVPAEFRWEYRPKSWAILSVNDRAVADPATVQRVAAGVTFGGDRPAAFPVRVTGLPDGLRSTRTSVAAPAEVMISLAVPGRDGELVISVSPSRPDGGRSGHPNTTLDGHPAFDTRLPHPGPKIGRVPPSRSQILTVYGVRGFDVDLMATGEPLRRLQAGGGLTGLYRRTTPLGADPARWTTEPLR